MTTQKGVLLNADEVRDLVKQNKDACTIQQATGIWKGEQENTLIIEIIQEEKEVVLPYLLKNELDQESVLVMYDRPEIEFI